MDYYSNIQIEVHNTFAESVYIMIKILETSYRAPGPIFQNGDAQFLIWAPPFWKTGPSGTSFENRFHMTSSDAFDR